MNQNQKKRAAKVAIERFCEELKEMLLSKNEAYGNSAYEPVRCFSKADPLEGINIRMDDKISRLLRGDNAGEDPELDLAGYIVLKKAYPYYVEELRELENS